MFIDASANHLPGQRVHQFVWLAHRWVPLHDIMSAFDMLHDSAGPFIVGQLLYLILSLGSSRVWCVKERLVWREERFLRAELEDLRRMLFDLVPPSYARSLIMGCERIKPSAGRVAVLQLDICGSFIIICAGMRAVAFSFARIPSLLLARCSPVLHTQKPRLFPALFCHHLKAMHIGRQLHRHLADAFAQQIGDNHQRPRQ